MDSKVIDAITEHERGQMINYLRIAGLKVEVILNFKRVGAGSNCVGRDRE